MSVPFQRALVIGNSGAGKSTFSRKLAARSGLPLVHLDREFWQPGWEPSSRAIWRAKVAQLAAGEQWIMDGNYGSSLDLRLPRADLVIWFDYPRGICLRRAIWRSARSLGRVRPDLAPACPEKFDFAFYRYVWKFNARERPVICAGLAAYGAHVSQVVIRADRDAERYLTSVSARA